MARACDAIDLHYQPMPDPMEHWREDAVLEAASAAAATAGEQQLLAACWCTHTHVKDGWFS
jgi:hypothetical protein